MMIEMKLENIAKMQEALAKFPAVLERQVSIGLEVAAQEVAGFARRNHRFVSRSGNLVRSIEVGMASGYGVPTAMVWLNPDITKTPSGFSYGIFVHDGTDTDGTGRHYIAPVRKKALRWIDREGTVCFSKGHWVRGIASDPFIYRALQILEDDGSLQYILNRQVAAAFEEVGL